MFAQIAMRRGTGRLAAAGLIVGLACSDALSTETFSTRFEKIKREATPEELYRILFDLPKGGDLHDHLGGAAFPETWLRLAAGRSFYTRVRFGKCTLECGTPLLRFHTVRESVWNALSPCCRKEYEPLSELDETEKAAFLSSLRLDEPGEGRDEFFERIWPRIGDVTDQADIVAEVAAENLRLFGEEGVRYVEFQVSPFGRRSGDRLLEGDEFHEILAERLSRPDVKDTGVTVRFQANVVRFASDAERRIEESYAFVDAHRDLWVSVNLVGREDDDRGYPLRFLETYRKMRRLYPRIPLALHAGEQDEPSFHVRDTLLLGADRIGHGTNLITDPDTLLLMRTGKFAVEVSLVSNRLLGYASDISRHPFPELLRLGVPVCLSTDDRGMWDSNMTDEWFTAVTEFHLSWEEIERLGRSSLEFAFVPEDVKAKLLEDHQRELERFIAAYGEGDWRRKAALVPLRPSGYARRNLLNH